MRKVVLFLIAMLSFSTLSSAAAAQANKLKNYNPDPNGEPWYTGLPELTPEQRVMIQQMPRLQPSLRLLTTKAAATSVDNSTNKYFRPIFNQEGGSCAQASGIGYTFTYEMAYLRDLDARISQNQYPVHYTWNFLNQGTGKGSWYFDGWDIARDNGIPDLITYGDLFTPHPYVEWMSGYDKYYAGMANRTLRYFAIDVSTPEGIETMRQYMLHHAEGEPVGGIVNLATFMDGVDYNVLAAGTPHAGETIITAFGPGNDPESGHAMTFVGYDDTVRYDYNGDGQYTNDIDINADGVVDLKDWEIGAVKLANSWGTSWKNQGFAWVMYRVLAHDRENGERGIQSKMVNGVEVKETNIPKMALKVTMTHSSRSLIRLGAGVADDVDAAVPDQQISYSLFNYQGGDWPMRGDSSDAIEIGLDVSKLYEMVGESGAKKFFLIVDENDP
ncbi:MAG: hypothetical protein JXA30_21640, partial [Deltaproteobacteria bacterium]|nr:hypothetical protein [Deltaproteobacteria bacterium]